jgi:hypothetical protein
MKKLLTVSMAITVIVSMSACSRPAELAALDAAQTAGPAPKILPLDQLIAAAGASSATADPSESLAERALRLRARARLLRAQ